MESVRTRSGGVRPRARRNFVVSEAIVLLLLMGTSSAIAVTRVETAHRETTAHRAFVAKVMAARARLERRLQPDPGWYASAGVFESDAYRKFAAEVAQIHAQGTDMAMQALLLRYGTQVAAEYQPVCESEELSSGNDCWWTTVSTADMRAASRDAARLNHILDGLLNHR